MISQMQKDSPLWQYFSKDGYDTRLLKDFGFIDEETHELFVRLLCQNESIFPARQHMIMKPEEFDTPSYKLLEQDQLLKLLDKLALPLQIRHWQLNISQETCLPDIPLKNIASTLCSDLFDRDVCVRWGLYSSAIVHVIDDLKLSSENIVDFMENRTQQMTSKCRAVFLETGLKQVLDGIGESLLQKEVIWEAKEEKLSKLFMNFSSLFDVANKKITQEQMRQKELKALSLLERAIIWKPSNELQAKVDAFDAVAVAKEKIQMSEEKSRNEEFKSRISALLKSRFNGGSNENF